MMNFSLAVGFMLVLPVLAYVGEAQAEPAPLSCEMQMLLHAGAAMQRDRGVSRQANTIGNTPDSDLTKKEEKAILDRVYIEKKNKTPDEIKNAVYEACQKSLAKPSQKGNCDVMAQMAKNLADLRNAGVSLAAVEDRLRRDGLSPEELSLGLTVARLVYKTSGTGQELKDAIRRKCK